jgi:catalase
MILFSDRGTPDGYHQMHGYSGHTFKWLKDDGSFVYTQLHLRVDGGFKTLDNATATRIAGENPEYGIESLFNTIEAGKFPSWTVYVQTMTPEQAEKFRYNVLDLTKVWPHSEFPLRPVGKLVLNENPQNYFAEIEQSAFSPSHLIPYIEPSADPVLQSRLFSYPDTHRHRLGVNYQQLPVNAPIVPINNFQRDGPATFISQGSRPNYQSSIQPLTYAGKKATIDSSVRDEARVAQHEAFVGGAWRDLSEITELDFEQPRALWSKVWNDQQREAYVNNVSGHFKNVKDAAVKARQLSVWAAVDQGLSDRIAAAIGHPKVQPLKVKSASEAVKFRANLGFKFQ